MDKGENTMLSEWVGSVMRIERITGGRNGNKKGKSNGLAFSGLGNFLYES
jgi:hypothetical protein